MIEAAATHFTPTRHVAHVIPVQPASAVERGGGKRASFQALSVGAVIALRQSPFDFVLRSCRMVHPTGGVRLVRHARIFRGTYQALLSPQ